MLVTPSWLTDVSSLTPAISPIRRSSGAATVAATVSGSAPGSVALTRTAARSVFGRLETGRLKYATAPARKSPIERSVVPIGRRIKGAEGFMAARPRLRLKAPGLLSHHGERSEAIQV